MSIQSELSIEATSAGIGPIEPVALRATFLPSWILTWGTRGYPAAEVQREAEIWFRLDCGEEQYLG